MRWLLHRYLGTLQRLGASTCSQLYLCHLRLHVCLLIWLLLLPAYNALHTCCRLDPATATKLTCMAADSCARPMCFAAVIHSAANIIFLIRRWSIRCAGDTRQLKQIACELLSLSEIWRDLKLLPRLIKVPSISYATSMQNPLNQVERLHPEC